MDNAYVKLPTWVVKTMLDMLHNKAYSISDTRWTTCETAMRESIKTLESHRAAQVASVDFSVAETLGYIMHHNGPNGTRFVNGDRHVWSVDEHWQTANVYNCGFHKHKEFRTLNEALHRPL